MVPASFCGWNINSGLYEPDFFGWGPPGPYGREQEEEAGWLQRAGIVILQDEGMLDS